MAILKIRDVEGNVQEILAIKGDQGIQGEKGDKGDKGDSAITDQTYSPESENAQSGKAVAEAIELNKEVVNISSIEAVYNSIDELPDTASNGTRLPVLSDGALPIKIYSFDNSNWEYIATVKGSTLYCVLTDNKIYRFTMAKPYFIEMCKTEVDQTYNPESENAQSGKAVAEAVGNVNNKYEFINKLILGYSILTTKPEDWETNFANYYENTGTVEAPNYKQLTELKEWKTGMFYSYGSDDVTINYLNADCYGQPFELKGVILDMTFPASSSRSLKFSLRSAQFTSIAHQLAEISISSAITSSKGWYQGRFEAQNGGVWTGIQNANYTTSCFISRQIPRNEPMRTLCLRDTAFPAGTTITIYGVRV